MEVIRIGKEKSEDFFFIIILFTCVRKSHKERCFLSELKHQQGGNEINLVKALRFDAKKKNF